MRNQRSRFLAALALSALACLPLSAATKVKTKPRATACPACNPGRHTVCVTTKGTISVDQQTVHLYTRLGTAQFSSKDGGEFAITNLDATAFTLQSVPPGQTTSCHWTAKPTKDAAIGHPYKYSVTVAGLPPLDPDVVIDNPPAPEPKRVKH